MTSAQLAQRLNELANAHNDGLINDEEYRNLRQGAFTQVESGTSANGASTIPDPIPIPLHGRTKPRALQFETAPPKPLRSKSSLASLGGLASFIRRPSTRRISSEPTDGGDTRRSRTQSDALASSSKVLSTSPEDVSSASGSPNLDSPLSPTSSMFKWSASLPRLLSPKGSSSSLKKTSRERGLSASTTNTAALSIERKHSHQSSVSSGSASRSYPSASSAYTSPANSPTKPKNLAISTPIATTTVLSSSAFLDDDDEEQTSQAISEVISMLEAEGRKLVASFNDLERTKLQKARERSESVSNGDLVLSPSASASVTTLLSVSASHSHSHSTSQLGHGSKNSATSALGVRRGAGSSLSITLSDNGSSRSVSIRDGHAPSSIHRQLSISKSHSLASLNNTSNPSRPSFSSNPLNGSISPSRPSFSSSLNLPMSPSRPSFSSSSNVPPSPSKSTFLNPPPSPSKAVFSGTGTPPQRNMNTGPYRNKRHPTPVLSSIPGPGTDISTGRARGPSPTSPTSSVFSTTTTHTQHSSKHKRKPSLLKSRSASNLSSHSHQTTHSLSALIEEAASSSPIVEEDEIDALGEAGDEVREVRKQRAEVVARYDERLAYLRAKLKSAELREKLLRK